MNERVTGERTGVQESSQSVDGLISSGAGFTEQKQEINIKTIHSLKMTRSLCFLLSEMLCLNDLDSMTCWVLETDGDMKVLYYTDVITDINIQPY